jgi:hypothetical protein
MDPLRRRNHQGRSLVVHGGSGEAEEQRPKNALPRQVGKDGLRRLDVTPGRMG